MSTFRLPKVIKVLDSLYRHSQAGEKRTNLFFNQQWETSASSAYISDLKIDYGINVSSEYTTNPETQARYKLYWISEAEMSNALSLLQRYGLHCTSNAKSNLGGVA